MPKTTLPSFEEYKAPWEVDSTGADIPPEDQNLDPALLKKKLYDVLKDRQVRTEERDALKTERDTLKGELDTERRKGEDETGKAKREAQEAIDAAKAEGALPALKLDVALDIEGITPAQAKRLASRLTGTTREELEADAQGLVADFGLVKPKDDGDDDVNPPAGRPRRPRAAADPEGPSGTALPEASDLEAVAKIFPRR